MVWERTKVYEGCNHLQFESLSTLPRALAVVWSTWLAIWTCFRWGCQLKMREEGEEWNREEWTDESHSLKHASKLSSDTNHWKWRITSKRKMRACKKIHYSIQIQVTPTTCNLWQKRSKTWTDMRDGSSLLLFPSPWVSISLSLFLFSFDTSHLILILFFNYSALGRERRESNRGWGNHSSPSQCFEGTHREFSRRWSDSDQDHVERRRFEDASDSGQRLWSQGESWIVLLWWER